MCMLTEAQSQSDCLECQLTFKLWELLASQQPKEEPKEEKRTTLLESPKQAEESSLISDSNLTQRVRLGDVRTMCMAVLRFNDGKRFMDAEEAPLLQSEADIGFRRVTKADPAGRYMLRYEELVQVWHQFEPFYTNRLQLLGTKIE